LRLRELGADLGQLGQDRVCRGPVLREEGLARLADAIELLVGFGLDRREPDLFEPGLGA